MTNDMNKTPGENNTPGDPSSSDSPASPALPADPRPRWQRMLGLRRREGRFLRWGLTRWGWCLAVLVVGLVGMGSMAEYSMRPDFCRSCHIMEPYYQAWHQSKHKGVPCVDCHFEPGLTNTMYGKFQASSQAVKYITKTYGSKPHAEIRDVSCMREGCHEKRKLEGKVNWAIKTTNGRDITIRFDHAPHLNQERRGKQLRCVSCHSQIVQGQHIVVTTDTCFLCHFKGVKHGRDDQTLGTCKGCHEAPAGQIRLTSTGVFDHADYAGRGVACQNCHADAVKGDGNVPQQVCWNCHNQTDQIAKYSETNFLHSSHVTQHKVECSSCHVKIEHALHANSPEELATVTSKAGNVSGSHLTMESGSCGMCHEQMHLGPREMFRGVGGRGVAAMPSPMSRAKLNCIACHTGKQRDALDADVAGQTFLATQERCDYCHGSKYKGSLADWKKTIATHLARAEAAYAAARGAVASRSLGAEKGLEAQRLLDDAAYNIRFVKLGYGVHNVTYATALLNVAIERSEKAARLAPDSAGESRETPSPVAKQSGGGL